ncbi:MAG: MBL fold metallo-hydrolase [Pseudomonadales bacterium]|nr:MBL fold metallo-hydrolase [Pseudomonadales bacterium]
MKISFHGAAKGVTGSCHLVSCGDKRILIDCGLYQGGRETEAQNIGDFGFDPAEIDYLLLTHAHLDHCGRIPLLVKRGFTGEIITTAASRELARLVMLDSAHIQEEESARRTRQAARRGKDTADIKPLYTTLDALNSLDYFGHTAQYETPVRLGEHAQATFCDAGHILGSASILLELEEDEQTRRVLFSGDIGYSDRAILHDPKPPSNVDVVVMETTYGDRPHKELKPSIEELYAAINETFERGGNVVIPSFALERTQEILYYLREGLEGGRLPRFMQVFLDSPMAISATEIFRRHSECYDKDSEKLFLDDKDPFGFPGLHFTRDPSESMAINRINSGAVIIAGSGMCNGGRVRHHFKQLLWRESSSVIFVGYGATGTLARTIIDGAETVKLFREEVTVRAKIYTLGGFSAHADCNELRSWHKKTGNPEKTFLVHGEPNAMGQFARSLKSPNIKLPELHSEHIL